MGLRKKRSDGMKDGRKRMAAGLASALTRGIAAAAATVLAVWSAPAASADNLHRDGTYQPIPNQIQPVFAAHIDMFGRTGMDTSQPSARVTMSNGCVMDWYFLANGTQGWIGNNFTLAERADVASGASEYCRPSTRILVLMLGDSATMEATDSINGGSWLFPV
jgi:hypothetical protein